MPDALYDLIIIGGGINGAGIAADAAQRGLRVLLAEAGDLAGGTSSASSKLIHGGLRYLEHYEFRLVREALQEREVLLANAPHIIRPLRFVLPLVEGMRSAVLMRAGLFLYDHLSRRERLGHSASILFATDKNGPALRPAFLRGFSYWDCWVDDARLVVLNAMAARNAGARILTRTAVTNVMPEGQLWRVSLGQQQVHGRALVNAAGPAIADVGRMIARGAPTSVPRVRLVRGSHIVVPRIAGTVDDAFILQNVDGRVVFALPFERDFTLVGTTDVTQRQSAAEPVSPAEVEYLLNVTQRYFRSPPAQSDVVWQFSGVRPLVDDGEANASAVSRDYRFELDVAQTPPLLHVIGGKITTYRRLAEAALEKLAPHLPPMKKSVTKTTPLPGGDIEASTFDAWFNAFVQARPDFPVLELRRLAERYGTLAAKIAPERCNPSDLGPVVAAGLRERELTYLSHEEWVQTAEDVLWRRTKSGLSERPLSAHSVGRLQNFIDRV